MIANSLTPNYTPDEYLALEAVSETKHEYFQGEIYAMAGAGNTHVLIVSNLVGLLRPHLRGSQCGIYASDTKVFIPSQPAYFYPDLVISCHPLDRSRDDGLECPCLIIEVLSPTTEIFDRGRKFQAYQTIHSLEYYLLVSQTEMRVDVYQRQGKKQWLLTTYGDPDQLTLPSLNFTCLVADIYEDIPLFEGSVDVAPEITG